MTGSGHRLIGWRCDCPRFRWRRTIAGLSAISIRPVRKAARPLVHDQSGRWRRRVTDGQLALFRCVAEVLDARIRPGKEEGLVPAVVPSDDVWRPSILSMHFEDQAISVGLAGVVAVNHDPFSWLCFHGRHLRRFQDVSPGPLPIGPNVLPVPSLGFGPTLAVIAFLPNQPRSSLAGGDRRKRSPRKHPPERALYFNI